MQVYLWFEMLVQIVICWKINELYRKFAKHYYGIVLVPDSDWLAVRKNSLKVKG